MKQILALPMCHKICTTMKVQAYEINSFKTGHPVNHFPYFIAV